MMPSNTVVIIKTVISVALSCVYFAYPCVYTKFPPIIWDALCCNRDKYGVILSVGLVFGAIGDVLLDINGDMSFLLGMLSFGIGHILDIYAFNLSNPQRSYLAIVACSLYFGLMMYLVLPYVSDGLIVPVILYGIVLCGAACMSTMRLLTGDPTLASTKSKWFAFIGSVVFLASDTMLAFELFRGTGSSFISDYAIMLTYYVAQLSIALSSYIDPPSQSQLCCRSNPETTNDEVKQQLIDFEVQQNDCSPKVFQPTSYLS